MHAAVSTHGVEMLTKSVVARIDEAPARSAYSVSECTSTRPPRPGVRVMSDSYADWMSKLVLEDTSLPSIVPGTTVCGWQKTLLGPAAMCAILFTFYKGKNSPE